MHLEIQIALNFVIAYLYNKLPRRRVNLFGEELEKALREKFQGHWYPSQPAKGSAFRCLKTGDAVDSVLHRAARESGVSISDILENLPEELSVWIDPGEVSYRTGEKNVVRILYSENIEDSNVDSPSADNEVNKTFHSISQDYHSIGEIGESVFNPYLTPATSPVVVSSPAPSISSSFKNSPNPSTCNNTFMQRPNAPLTFTTATFAQTKFGSTKLKTTSKRANSTCRLSPTEFSNFLKQRSVLQQHFYHLHDSQVSSGTPNIVLDNLEESPINVTPLSKVAFTRNENVEPILFPGVGIGVFPKTHYRCNQFFSKFQQENKHIFSQASIDAHNVRSNEIDLDSLESVASSDPVLSKNKSFNESPTCQSQCMETENEMKNDRETENHEESMVFENPHELHAVVNLGLKRSEHFQTSANPNKIDNLKLLYPSGNESYSHVVVAN